MLSKPFGNGGAHFKLNFWRNVAVQIAAPIYIINVHPYEYTQNKIKTVYVIWGGLSDVKYNKDILYPSPLLQRAYNDKYERTKMKYSSHSQNVYQNDSTGVIMPS